MHLPPNFWFSGYQCQYESDISIDGMDRSFGHARTACRNHPIIHQSMKTDLKNMTWWTRNFIIGWIHFVIQWLEIDTMNITHSIYNFRAHSRRNLLLNCPTFENSDILLDFEKNELLYVANDWEMQCQLAVPETLEYQFARCVCLDFAKLKSHIFMRHDRRPFYFILAIRFIRKNSLTPENKISII